MTRDHIQLLFEYDRWANQRALQAASALTGEQFTRDLSGGLRSVRDALVHIIGGEWGWLTYWKEPSPSAAFLADLWDRHDALFRADAFPDLSAVRAKWAELEKEQEQFVNSLSEGALRRMLPLGARPVSLGQLMQHLVNHSTYHRGQVAFVIRQLGAQPLTSDFHVFLRQVSDASASAR